MLIMSSTDKKPNATTGKVSTECACVQGEGQARSVRYGEAHRTRAHALLEYARPQESATTTTHKLSRTHAHQMTITAIVCVHHQGFLSQPAKERGTIEVSSMRQDFNFKSFLPNR